MNKVFSAKRKTVKFDYEFLDGKKVELEARGLSTKEQEIVNNDRTENEDFITNFKNILKKQLATNDKELVDSVIKEQYENSDIVEFSNSLAALVREEKAKK